MSNKKSMDGCGTLFPIIGIITILIVVGVIA